MKELKGATMGIVGYGDIGYECAKRAKVMGMHIVALRRNPERSANDDFIDKVSVATKIYFSAIFRSIPSI